MKATPFAAFGYVVFLCTMEEGESREVSITDPTGLYTNGYYFYTEGVSKFTIKESGVALPDRVAGWLNTEHTDAGANEPATIIMHTPQPASWVCLSKLKNVELPSSLNSIVLKADEHVKAPLGSNLFLARGTVEVAGKEFVAPRQIRVRSGEVTVTAKSESYLIKFPS